MSENTYVLGNYSWEAEYHRRFFTEVMADQWIMLVPWNCQVKAWTNGWAQGEQAWLAYGVQV